jgi:hypothetical protein
MLLTVLPGGLFHRCNLPHHIGGIPKTRPLALAPVGWPRRHREPDLLRLPAATPMQSSCPGRFALSRQRFDAVALCTRAQGRGPHSPAGGAFQEPLGPCHDSCGLALGGDFQVRLRFQRGVLGDCPNRHHGNEPSDHGHIPSPAAAVRAASVRSHMSCPRSAGGRLATLRRHRHARPPSSERRYGEACPGKAKTCARSPRPDSKGRAETCRDNAE